MTGFPEVSTVDPRLVRLRESVATAPVVWKGEYPYFIHPLTDGVPRLAPALLRDALDLITDTVDWDQVDIIIGIEAMGLPFGTALALEQDRPLVVARKRSYGLEGEITVDQSTGYSKGSIHLNDIQPGERVLIVDDVISTGGTLRAVLQAIEDADAIIAQVVCVFEKGLGMEELIEEFGWPLESLVKVEMIDGVVHCLT